MIIDVWYGVINRKGELMAVEESEEMARMSSSALEVNPKSPTNRLIPVTILRSSLQDAILEIVDRAMARIEERKKEDVVNKAKPFTQHKEGL